MGNSNTHNNFYSNNINAHTFYNEGAEHENNRNTFDNKNLKKPNIKIYNLLNAENNQNLNRINNFPKSSKNFSNFNLTGKVGKINFDKNKAYKNSSNDNFTSNTERNHRENNNMNENLYNDNFNNFRNFNQIDNNNYMGINEEEIMPNYPLDQQKFINAVKNIHDKLINLNI